MAIGGSRGNESDVPALDPASNAQTRLEAVYRVLVQRALRRRAERALEGEEELGARAIEEQR